MWQFNNFSGGPPDAASRTEDRGREERGSGGRGEEEERQSGGKEGIPPFLNLQINHCFGCLMIFIEFAA